MDRPAGALRLHILLWHSLCLFCTCICWFQTAETAVHVLPVHMPGLLCWAVLLFPSSHKLGQVRIFNVTERGCRKDIWRKALQCGALHWLVCSVNQRIGGEDSVVEFGVGSRSCLQKLTEQHVCLCLPENLFQSNCYTQVCLTMEGLQLCWIL